MKTLKTLIEGVKEGHPSSVAKLISMAEDEPLSVKEIELALPALSGRTTFLIGLTGAPGCGKSTLVDKLIRRFRKAGQSVAVIAVDPTSPTSGGSILGDRVRMSDHFSDEEVFIRSMATRGELGGIARATATAARILAASGKDVVLIETVGVGQLEVAVRRCVHALVVVLTPSSGDEIQFMKAGLMEVGDLYIVNKSDELKNRDVLKALRQASMEQFHGRTWIPPVLETVALENRGIDELYDALLRFRDHLGHKNGSG